MNSIRLLNTTYQNLYLADTSWPATRVISIHIIDTLHEVTSQARPTWLSVGDSEQEGQVQPSSSRLTRSTPGPILHVP